MTCDKCHKEIKDVVSDSMYDETLCEECSEELGYSTEMITDEDDCET